MRHGFLQTLPVFGEERHQHPVVDVGSLVHCVHHQLRAIHEHIDRGIVFVDKRFVVFIFLVSIVADETLNQQVSGKEHHSGKSISATNHQHQCDEERHQERHKSRHEPSHNHHHHTRDAIHGTVSAPHTVRQRRAHRHHKHHIGGRERQFERSADTNQDRSGSQIHHGANAVEITGSPVFFSERFKSLIDSVLPLLRKHLFIETIHLHRIANERSGERRGIKPLIFFLLRCKGEFGL